jgi:hypothetical protein
MKVDIQQLRLWFDQLEKFTEEELGIYWFKRTRADGLSIIIAFSIYEDYVDVMIRNSSKIDISSVGLKNCSELKTQGEESKYLEILHDERGGRCFVSLDGGCVLNYRE